MPSKAPSEVTRLLVQAGDGDADALAKLAPLVYDELRALAHRVLRGQPPGQTLRTTGLVHEVYLKLVDRERVQWEGRSHFFGVAAKAMRGILVDYVRSRASAKRGGDRQRVPLDEAVAVLEERDIDLLELDGALTRLGEMDDRKGRVVELRFFAGLSIEDTAQVLGVSHTTVERDWEFARAWLRSRIS